MINEWAWYAKDMCYEAFKVLEAGENNVNLLFFGLAAIFGMLWIRQMMAYDKEAEANGTIP